MARLEQKEIARVLGVSPPRVTQLKAIGMPVSSIDLAAAWYRENVDQRLSPKLAPSPVPLPAMETMAEVIAEAYDIQRARAKREHHEAGMAALKERQMLGDLVEAGRVKRAVSSWAAMARSAFEKIPDKVSERVAATSDAQECHALLCAEIDLVLVDLANGARTMRLESDDGRG